MAVFDVFRFSTYCKAVRTEGQIDSDMVDCYCNSQHRKLYESTPDESNPAGPESFEVAGYLPCGCYESDYNISVFPILPLFPVPAPEGDHLQLLLAYGGPVHYGGRGIMAP
ncbi:hypothetical protein D3C85_1269760 [compost metagenome]